jgi:hypothetical protein
VATVQAPRETKNRAPANPLRDPDVVRRATQLGMNPQDLDGLARTYDHYRQGYAAYQAQTAAITAPFRWDRPMLSRRYTPDAYRREYGPQQTAPSVSAVDPYGVSPQVGVGGNQVRRQPAAPTDFFAVSPQVGVGGPHAPSRRPSAATSRGFPVSPYTGVFRNPAAVAGNRRERERLAARWRREARVNLTTLARKLHGQGRVACSRRIAAAVRVSHAIETLYSRPGTRVASCDRVARRALSTTLRGVLELTTLLNRRQPRLAAAIEASTRHAFLYPR